jgi:hypothetical protein
MRPNYSIINEHGEVISSGHQTFNAAWAWIMEKRGVDRYRVTLRWVVAVGLAVFIAHHGLPGEMLVLALFLI